MKHRQEVQARAKGGGVMPPSGPITNAYSGGSSKVVPASRKRADGGAVGSGPVERKFGGSVAGAKAATRMDRPGRKSGGRVGADKAPMSSAANSSCAPLKAMH